MKERAEHLFAGLYGRVFDIEEHETGFTVRGAAPFVEWAPGGGPPSAIGYLRLTVDITLYDGFAIIAAHPDNGDFILPDSTGYKISNLGSRTYLVLDEQEKWPTYVAYGDLLLVAVKDTSLRTPQAFSTRWVESGKMWYAMLHHDRKYTAFSIGGSVVKLPDNYQELITYPLKVR